MKKIASGLLILLSFYLNLSADFYLKSLTRTDPINAFNQSLPAQEIISEQWIGNDFYYVNTGQGFSYLYDLKKNLIYLIAPRTKSYLEIRPPVNFSSLLPPDLTPMAQALEQMTISVTPTGQSKIINNLTCQGYHLKMTMMMYPIEMTIWASEELPEKLKNFLDKVWPEIIKLELKASGRAAAELVKVKGLWMAYETRAQMMGIEITSRTEVVEFGQKVPAKDTYSLPQGYRKKDRLEMEDIQAF
ncbi:MAG: hypothetical protein ACPLRA_04110 [Candidatus Saccharicenans sp.]